MEIDGMTQNAAMKRLDRMLFFSLVEEVGRNICYQCEEVINNYRELSVEHKVSHMGDSKLFWSKDNLAYSHLACNVAAGLRGKGNRRNSKIVIRDHGTVGSYAKGCRCKPCRETYSVYQKKRRGGSDPPGYEEAITKTIKKLMEMGKVGGTLQIREIKAALQVQDWECDSYRLSHKLRAMGYEVVGGPRASIKITVDKEG